MTQYEALNYDGTERRANYRFVSYRIDILHALGKREAAAIIFEILYRWETDVHCKRLLKDIEARKKAGLPPLTEEEVADQMWTYMSYNDFVRESGSALGYNTVIRMLAYLIEEKVIEQRENHDPRYPDYEYRINKEVVRKLLKALPVSPVFTAKVPKKKNSSTQMGTPSDSSTHLGIHAQGSTRMGIGSTHPGTEVYPNGGTSQKDTENSQNERTSAPSVESPKPDSLTHSSTPSLSLDVNPSIEQMSTPVDNSVHNQPSSVEHPDTPHHIANQTIENVEPTNSVESLTTRNASSQRNTEPLLTAEGRRVQGYWSQLGFESTSASNTHWNTLSKHIHSFEQIEGLYKYARLQLVNAKDPTVHPGNMVKSVNGWKQQLAPPPEPPKSGKPKKVKITPEYLASLPV